MSRAGAAVAAVAFVVAGGAAVYWGPELLNRDQHHAPTERCAVTHGDVSHSLTAEQANNAALIAAVGAREGFGVAGITVALATAIQESSLRNLNHGDRDSVGLFQQRPSQGWGSVAQIVDPYYSTETFYAALLKVDGWEGMAVTDAAQAVQKSGFPLAYADHESEARAWALAFTGDGTLVTCSVTGPAVSTPQEFAARLAADFGQGANAVDVRGTQEDSTVLGVRPATDSTQARAAVAAWSMATASRTGVTWVDGDDTLTRTDGTIAQVEHTEERASYPGILVAVKAR
ncbi:hypothetical protein [Demequina sp.]|uniref:hypothetical protein n=1 Tax=Demequina sp. TaxID=2050685 RepID=UPI0025BA920E|nr:hypothetical protein [Demequina sp.]